MKREKDGGGGAYMYICRERCEGGREIFIMKEMGDLSLSLSLSLSIYIYIYIYIYIERERERERDLCV